MLRSASAPGMEDPFEGMLERSAVAQTLRQARASLARPTRPFTPADRSLFQPHTATEDASALLSRPSSSYSLDQIKFSREPFVCPSPDSMLSTRSSLRSQRSQSFSTIPEGSHLTDPESGLQEPEPVIDIVSFTADGRIEGEVHLVQPNERKPHKKSKSKTSRRDPAEFQYEEDEYGNAAADQLSMQMPPPDKACSDEGSDDEDGASAPAAGRACKGSSEGSDVENRQPQLQDSSDTITTKSRRKSTAVKGSWSAALRTALEQLEEAVRVGAAASPRSLVSSVSDLVTDLRGPKAKSSHLAQAPRLLHAVLALMDLTKAEPSLMLRLSRSAVDLLQLPGTVPQDVGGHGTQAEYLNVLKALFKLSKDAGNDAHFREEGVLDGLLTVLEDAELDSDDLKVFAVGVLKNVSNSDENQKYLTKRGILHILRDLMQPECLKGRPKEPQLLIQITALLRNLSASSKRQHQIVDLDLLGDLTRISRLHQDHEELQVNISRVLAKLSLHDAPCEAFCRRPEHVEQVVLSLRRHSSSAPLVLRHAFVLGNLTARNNDARTNVAFKFNGIGVVSDLMQQYWGCDQQAASSAQETQDTESVLVKLVRLVANVAISPEAGLSEAQSPAIVEVLLGILEQKAMPAAEELVLNATAAITNLLYYDSPENLLFSEGNKQRLCRLLRPLLLESYNVEALVESARALGNLSRHPDARRWMCEFRIDEILSILLAHDDRDLVFYVCGALVNVASEAHSVHRLASGGVRSKLAAVLKDAETDDGDLMLCAAKVLANLRQSSAAEASWCEEERLAVMEGLQRVAGLQGRGGCDVPPELFDLVAGLLDGVGA